MSASAGARILPWASACAALAVGLAACVVWGFAPVTPAGEVVAGEARAGVSVSAMLAVPVHDGAAPAPARAGALPELGAIAVHAPPGTPATGVLLLVHRPEFAPRTTLADELWSAFLAARDQEFVACVDSVADRLARLGWRCVLRAPWRDHAPQRLRLAADESPATSCVALSSQAVGYAELPACAVDVVVALVGVGEVVTPAHDELWASAGGPFSGPHRLRDGVAPAARLRLLGVDHGNPLRVRRYAPLDLVPNHRAVATWSPQSVERVYAAAESWPYPCARPTAPTVLEEGAAW